MSHPSRPSVRVPMHINRSTDTRLLVSAPSDLVLPRKRFLPVLSSVSSPCSHTDQHIGKANKDDDNHPVPYADEIDKLDETFTMPYHHDGPFDATLAYRNNLSGKDADTRAPVNAVRISNMPPTPPRRSTSGTTTSSKGTKSSLSSPWLSISDDNLSDIVDDEEDEKHELEAFKMKFKEDRRRCRRSSDSRMRKTREQKEKKRKNMKKKVNKRGAVIDRKFSFEWEQKEREEILEVKQLGIFGKWPGEEFASAGRKQVWHQTTQTTKNGANSLMHKLSRFLNRGNPAHFKNDKVNHPKTGQK